jgi:hypothetical protein
MDNQMYCINGVRISTREVMDAIEELVSPLLANLPDDEEYVEATLQVNDHGWLFHTGDPSYIQAHQGYWGDATIFPGYGRALVESELEQAALQMLDNALSGYWDSASNAFITRDCLEGDDWTSIYDSQEIEAVLESVGVDYEGITCLHARLGDGDYQEVWVTDDCAPYRYVAEFWRAY